MKDLEEVLREKELDLSLVRKQIESLRIVASLLSDDGEQTHDLAEDEVERPIPPAREDNAEEFSSEGLTSRFWKTRKRGKG
jgi:hypothetical protein